MAAGDSGGETGFERGSLPSAIAAMLLPTGEARTERSREMALRLVWLWDGEGCSGSDGKAVVSSSMGDTFWSSV